MVVNMRNITLAFLVLSLLYISSWYYFNTSIEAKSVELKSKRELMSTLSKLESKWSKNAQKTELKRVYKLLDLFDVVYTTKKKRKREVISMELKAQNADKVVAIIINANIDIKKLEIKKIDNHRVKLIVELL